MDVLLNLLGQLFKAYGIVGAAIGGLLIMLWRVNQKAEKALRKANAKVLELEQHKDEMYMQQIDMHKAMIQEYVELVQSKIQILSQLTNCINAMNDTLKRIEFKQELRD
jgi:hypothetical protein